MAKYRQVAVTGLGAVSPVGCSVAESWDALINGRSGIADITHYDASNDKVRFAGEVKNFNPEAVIPAKEVRKQDLFTLFSLVAADEAMRDAGLDVFDEEMSYHAGVCIGVGLGGMASIEETHSRLLEGKRVSPFFIPRIISNMSAGHVSIRYNCKNYSAAVASACASSNHSIGLAKMLIERGDAKIMIAGGAESTISSVAVNGFAAMNALSTRNDNPQAASRPYDRDRDGFVMGEGCGILILEDYEHARQRGAEIYCLLTGFGASSDAHHITDPSAPGQIYALRNCLKDAGVNTEDIQYVNTHGTSTPAGDINELSVIEEVFGASAQKLMLSSTKSMTGHLLGGAGGIEAVISVMVLKTGVIPPTINIEHLDEKCRLDVVPNTAREGCKVKNVVSTSFGFGGANAIITLTGN